MLNKVNLIIIYGKTGSYKSSLAATLVNGIEGLACYIDLEDNKHVKFENTKVKVFNDKNEIDLEFIKNVISDYDLVLIDPMESLELKIDDLIYLKELAKANSCKLIMLSNSTSDDNFKDIADLLIHSIRN